MAQHLQFTGWTGSFQPPGEGSDGKRDLVGVGVGHAARALWSPRLSTGQHCLQRTLQV